VIGYLACPATTYHITNNTISVMDAILDLTRKAMNICSDALFVNASSFGAADINESKQGGYNVAKRCMEIYLSHSKINYINYRIPSVYGQDASTDSFIKRCVLGTAYKPTNSSQIWPISHVDDVVEALINLSEIKIEYITLGEIYEQFTSGKRNLIKHE
jgi:nucleoside-diphosphate-sugar epimerase